MMNHMTGEHTAFSELNTGIHGTIWFNDGSMVTFEGQDMVLFKS